MPNSDELRQLVVQVFADLGVPDVDGCFEAILIRDGFYVGRQFRCETAKAVWLSDADVVQFYRDGKLIRTVPFAAALPEMKKAA